MQADAALWCRIDDEGKNAQRMGKKVRIHDWWPRTRQEGRRVPALSKGKIPRVDPDVGSTLTVSIIGILSQTAAGSAGNYMGRQPCGVNFRLPGMLSSPVQVEFSPVQQAICTGSIRCITSMIEMHEDGLWA